MAIIENKLDELKTTCNSNLITKPEFICQGKLNTMKHMRIGDDGHNLDYLLGDAVSNSQVNVDPSIQLLNQHQLMHFQQQQQKKKQESDYLKLLALRSRIGSSSPSNTFLGVEQNNDFNLRNQLNMGASSSRLDPVRQLEMERYKLFAIEEEMKLRDRILQEQLLQKSQQTEGCASASSCHELQQRSYMPDFHHDLEDAVIRQERLAAQRKIASNLRSKKASDVPSDLNFNMFDDQVYSQEGRLRLPHYPPGNRTDVVNGNSLPLKMNFSNLNSSDMAKFANSTKCSNMPMNTHSNLMSNGIRIGSQNIGNHLLGPLQSMPFHDLPSDQDRIIAQDLLFKGERARHDEAVKLDHVLMNQHTVRGKNQIFNHLDALRLARIEEQVRQEEMEHIRKREALILEMHKQEEAIRTHGEQKFQRYIPLMESHPTTKEVFAQKCENAALSSHALQSPEIAESTFGLTKSSCRDDISGYTFAKHSKKADSRRKRKAKTSVECTDKVVKRAIGIQDTKKTNDTRKPVMSSQKSNVRAHSSTVPHVQTTKIKEEGNGSIPTSHNPKPDNTDSTDGQLRFFNNGVEVNASGNPISKKLSNGTKVNIVSSSSSLSSNIVPNMNESLSCTVKSATSVSPNQPKLTKSNEQAHNKRRCTVSFHELISYVKHRIPEAESNLQAVEHNLAKKNVQIITLSAVNEIICELQLLLDCGEKKKKSTVESCSPPLNYKRRIMDCIQEIEGFKSGLMNNFSIGEKKTVEQNKSAINSSKMNRSSPSLEIRSAHKHKVNRNDINALKIKKENSSETEGPKPRGIKKAPTTKNECPPKCHRSSLISSDNRAREDCKVTKGALKLQTNRSDANSNVPIPANVYPSSNDQRRTHSLKKTRESMNEQEKTLSAANVLLDFMKKGS